MSFYLVYRYPNAAGLSAGGNAATGNAASANDVPSAQSAPVAPVKEAPAGVSVNLSAEGTAKAKAAKPPIDNSDIEQSGLPDSVQKILKALRELQRKIDEKMDELQAIMSDKKLSDQERQNQVSSLQATLATLNTQVRTNTSDLATTMNRLHLSESDKTKAGTLLLKKVD